MTSIVENKNILLFQDNCYDSKEVSNIYYRDIIIQIHWDNKLGTFNLEGIPSAPRGTPQIEVSFDLDANSILKVTACDKKTGNKNEVVIENDTGRLSKADIDKMISDSEKYAEDDKKVLEKINAKNSLETYLLSLKTSEKVKELSEEDRIKIETLIKEGEEFLSNEQDDYERKKMEIESAVEKIYTDACPKSDENTTKVEDID